MIQQKGGVTLYLFICVQVCETQGAKQACNSVRVGFHKILACVHVWYICL